jgi:transposase
MEATGIYHLSAYQHLLDIDAHVKVFNSLELKRFKGRIRKTKTDKLDAQAIAEAMVLAREPSYHPISEPSLVRIRELCRLRERMVKKASLCKIQATRDMDILCRGYTEMFEDIFGASSIDVMKSAVRVTKFFQTDEAELAKILARNMSAAKAGEKAAKLSRLFKSAIVPEHMTDVCICEIHMLIQEYELLRYQIKRIERRIENEVGALDSYLTTIPGVGLLTAGIILGELGDLKRFRGFDQLTAYAGLDPAVIESGRSHKTGHISKRGSPLLREALYNAALPAIRINPVCKQVYSRLKSKGKHHKICMVAVARKLLHIAYAVEINQKEFYVPAYMTTPETSSASAEAGTA